jgi:hypothetical protein
MLPESEQDSVYVKCGEEECRKDDLWEEYEVETVDFAGRAGRSVPGLVCNV